MIFLKKLFILFKKIRLNCFNKLLKIEKKFNIIKLTLFMSLKVKNIKTLPFVGKPLDSPETFIFNIIEFNQQEIIDYVDKCGVKYLYSGERVNGIPNGFGILFSVSKYSNYKIRIEYKGNFINNYPHGEGILFYYEKNQYLIPSESYKGDVLGLMPHGFGINYFYNSITNIWYISFAGCYEYGKRANEGKEFFLGTSKIKFIGCYQNGFKNGFGVEFNEDGTKIFEGFHYEGVRHGHGIFYNRDFEIRGFWQFDKLSHELYNSIASFAKESKKRKREIEEINTIKHFKSGSNVLIMKDNCKYTDLILFLYHNSS